MHDLTEDFRCNKTVEPRDEDDISCCQRLTYYLNCKIGQQFQKTFNYSLTQKLQVYLHIYWALWLAA